MIHTSDNAFTDQNNWHIFSPVWLCFVFILVWDFAGYFGTQYILLPANNLTNRMFESIGTIGFVIAHSKPGKQWFYFNQILFTLISICNHLTYPFFFSFLIIAYKCDSAVVYCMNMFSMKQCQVDKIAYPWFFTLFNCCAIGKAKSEEKNRWQFY